MRHLAVVAAQRLRNQCITHTELSDPADVVRWLGAVQSQEYEAAKWGLGLRMPGGSTDADVERAFSDGDILRTHVMRPTWHFVTPADIRWLLELTAPRVHRAASPYRRHLELDAPTLVRATRLMERALRDGQHLTRRELGERLRRAGVAAEGERLGQMAMYAELEGVICSGPRRGRQSTYALVSERAPDPVRLTRDEALATLSRRYFASHGPATVRDFAWWSGLTMADGRRGLEMNNGRRDDIEGRTYWTLGDESARPSRRQAAHLLPIYDEYLVSYRDRDAVPHGPSVIARGSREAVNFRHALIIDGHVTGTWRTTRTSKAVRVDVISLRRLSTSASRALTRAVQRFERFVDVPIELVIG